MDNGFVYAGYNDTIPWRTFLYLKIFKPPPQVSSLFNYTGINADGSSVTYTTWHRTYR